MAAVELAARRMRVHPENKFDILASTLDTDATIANSADHFDTTPLLHFVPLERASVERSEYDVRVVRVELALIPAQNGLLTRPPPCSGGGGGYMNTKSSRKFVIRSSRSPSSGSRHSHSAGANGRTSIAFAYATPHAGGIRVPQAGWEERVGDDNREGGAPVGRERARRDGEWQARVDERAKVRRWELGARGARRGRKDGGLFLHFDWDWLGRGRGECWWSGCWDGCWRG